MAVGAWSARMEIAAFLENGISAAEILEVIRKGEESETPLRSAEGPAASNPGGVSKPSGSSTELRRPQAASPVWQGKTESISRLC